MKVVQKKAVGAALVSLVAIMTVVTQVQAHQGEHTVIPTDTAQYSHLDNAINEVAVAPKITQPEWLTKQIAAEQAAQQVSTPVKTAQKHVTYSVQTLGTVQASVSEFKTLVQQTLTDGRGWASLGISFQQASSGGSFNLILAQAEEIGKIPGCHYTLSCRVGVNVYINDDRWRGATDVWNGAGGSLRDYRHYVVNHEVGHWLGHGHRGCGGSGQLSPVMQQQSKGLDGCKINGWPLPSEMYAPNLGI